MYLIKRESTFFQFFKYMQRFIVITCNFGVKTTNVYLLRSKLPFHTPIVFGVF